MGRTRILLSDAYPVVREGIKSVLRDDTRFEIVSEVMNGLEASRVASVLQPDVIIMENPLTEPGGVHTLRVLRRAVPLSRMIIFTADPRKEHLAELFGMGVSAYILKDAPLSELVHAIDMASQGLSLIGSTLPSHLLKHAKSLSAGRRPRAGLKQLTDRQWQVFRLLAEGMSIRAIAGILGTSPKTIETHKYRIMDRLGAQTLNDLTRIAVRSSVIQV